MRRAWKWWLAGALGWLLSSAGAMGQGTAKQPAPPTFRIAGVVVDAATGARIGRAEVWSGDDTGIRTSADVEGRFVLDGLEEGKYPLYATAPGYLREGYNQHGTFFTGIVAGKGADSEHLIFKLHRQAVIYGRVSDERGEAVRDAAVWLFVEGLNFGKQGVRMQKQVQTNDEGSYRFAHVEPGKYYVGVGARPWYAEHGVKYHGKEPEAGAGTASRVEAPGADPLLDVVYPLTYFAGATEESGAVPLTAKPGDALEANVRLTPVPSVHLLLTNVEEGKGRREEGLSVEAWQTAFESVRMPIVQGATEVSPGVWEVGGLPPGEVHVAVRGGAGETNVRMNATEGASVDMSARPATSNVSGVVTASDGTRGVARGGVMLSSGEETPVAGRIKNDGTFTLTGVGEGTYQVLVNTGVGEDYIARITAVGAKVVGRAVKIERGTEVKLTVTLGSGLGRIAGVVRMEGRGRAGVMILLVPETAGLSEADLTEMVRMDQSDSDGSFALGGILPGKYVLMAIEDGWDLEWRSEVVLAPYRAKGMRMEIGANERKNLTVEGMKVEGSAAQ